MQITGAYFERDETASHVCPYFIAEVREMTRTPDSFDRTTGTTTTSPALHSTRAGWCGATVVSRLALRSP